MTIDKIYFPPHEDDDDDNDNNNNNKPETKTKTCSSLQEVPKRLKRSYNNIQKKKKNKRRREEKRREEKGAQPCVCVCGDGIHTRGGVLATERDKM